MTRTVLSSAAERGIVAIIEWIAAENPVAAKGFRVALDKPATGKEAIEFHIYGLKQEGLAVPQPSAKSAYAEVTA